MKAPSWHPDFIVIGAVKAATTWIQARLQENPQIFMPDPEPHYFSSGFDHGEQWYRSFFRDRPETAEVIGEKSADYLAHPLAAHRIAQTLPEARLVLQLRNPVARAYSDYKMFFRRGQAKGPPEDYLQGAESPYPRFLEDGLYARHLSRWFDLFPREQILIYLYEDVAVHPQRIVEAVSAHIGVAPVFRKEAAAERENNSQAAILPLPLRKALAPLKDSVRPLRGKQVFENVRSLLAREITYPPLSPALRERLTDYYARDIETLEAICGLDLSRWKATARNTA
ncbi:sulfotransferase family protein [Novosphingobium aerophilum]|uniref:sulfotransferase family protein n=1 Tax=Novosphingobium TaxID=165696 RepID=UPI0006C85D45|nr:MULTISPECIES: sulfotransferase [unclassified Novosphingobium]KPH65959.1 sulfotransferase [Novosphingobium sp. ST904]TCM38481.1 sulfotransferase family protein [Novosphingobium sp. ST904]WRT92508.1 sulfotransferase [Novosphingobium sp. RL4]